ncbi:MAG: hypothetical protein HY033_13915 [Ignavibacteriae bacterium]|nr:hypothetical protein [Ignavibacteriota bacterium]
MGTILAILFWGFIIFILVKLFSKSKKMPLVFSHWYHMVENMKQSSQQFYQCLEESVKRRNLEIVKTSRVDHHEGGILSAKREYFRVKRKEHIFDICAAPYGNGFFVSWWLGETPSTFWEMMLKIPFIGRMLFAMFRPETYYKLDTALMFQSSIHQAVLEVLDDTTKAQGLRSLTELERKPILSDLIKR